MTITLGRIAAAATAGVLALSVSACAPGDNFPSPDAALGEAVQIGLGTSTRDRAHTVIVDATVQSAEKLAPSEAPGITIPDREDGSLFVVRYELQVVDGAWHRTEGISYLDFDAWAAWGRNDDIDFVNLNYFNDPEIADCVLPLPQNIEEFRALSEGERVSFCQLFSSENSDAELVSIGFGYSPNMRFGSKTQWGTVGAVKGQ